MSEYKNLQKVVRRGCVLSPELFNLYSEKIFENIENVGGVNIGEKYNNIKYADDTLLIAEWDEDVKILLEEVEEISNQWGHKLNREKTKYMTSNKKHNSSIKDLKLNNGEIMGVNRYTYLGSKITADGRADEDIKFRIKR